MKCDTESVGVLVGNLYQLDEKKMKEFIICFTQVWKDKILVMQKCYVKPFLISEETYTETLAIHDF